LLIVELAGWGPTVRNCLMAPVLPQDARRDLGACLAIAAALAAITAISLTLATWRLRPVVAAELSGRARRGSLGDTRPAPGDSPLRWKERYVGELGYLSFLRAVPSSLKLGAVALLGLWQEVDYDPWKPMIQGMVFLVTVGVLTGIRCSGVVTGEREKETWSSLLLTPLEPRQILRGKLWGDVEAPFVTLFFGLCAWGLVYYLGANGIRASVRGPSSWMSLIDSFTSAGLAMLQFGLICAALAGGVAVMLLAYLLRGPSLDFLIEAYVVCFLGLLVLCLFATSEQMLEEAEKALERNDRVMQRERPERRGRREQGEPAT
jgi:hypothetical protein